MSDIDLINDCLHYCTLLESQLSDELSDNITFSGEIKEEYNKIIHSEYEIVEELKNKLLAQKWLI